MPPRLRPSCLPSSISTCPTVCPSSTAQPSRSARQFSQSSCRQVTLRRRKFYAWLNGPGRALKQPLPNSTNYLGAYDRFGNLVRGTLGPQSQEASKGAQDASAQPAPAEKEGDEAQAPEGQESPDELEMAILRQEAKERKAKKDQKDENEDRLPPETVEDLRPFPLNRYFRSQPVLSEELREAIYQSVVSGGMTVPLASIHYGVSNERVGAVIRLKQMEKEWIAQGKTLAIPYSKAVLAMLPKTPHVEGKGQRPPVHEPINDLIVHPATRQQLFVPVAESRRFTRVDAGKAFDNKLLPADDRIPHPDLVKAERDAAAGLSLEKRNKLAIDRFNAARDEKKRREEARKKYDLATLKTIPQRRWDFVFRDISVESVGRNGRDPRGVGWRYGIPHQDRKKGQVKIPTQVEA